MAEVSTSRDSNIILHFMGWSQSGFVMVGGDSSTGDGEQQVAGESIYIPFD